MSEKPYRDYNTYLRGLFGCRVQKITVDAGLACPNRDGSAGWGGCVYCNARGSGTGASREGLSITEQVEAGKARLAARYKARKFLVYFQSFSNTYAPLDKLKALYGEALAVPDVVGLTIGTRPDCVPDPVLDHIASLSEDKLIWMEYGLQSAHEATLCRIRRGHTVAAFDDALARTRACGLPVCVHVIIGLPGEGPEEVMATARFLASRDIQAVKVHLLYVVKGTVLDGWLRSGEYSCLTREEYVELAAELLAHLPPDVIVQRVTGDPHPEELAAPFWALEKQKNIEALHAYMRERGLRQGVKYERKP